MCLTWTNCEYAHCCKHACQVVHAKSTVISKIKPACPTFMVALLEHRTAACYGVYKQFSSFSGNYSKEVEEDEAVIELSNQILAHLAATESIAKGFRAQFESFSHLWSTPIQPSLQVCPSQFCVPTNVSRTSDLLD